MGFDGPPLTIALNGTETTTQLDFTARGSLGEAEQLMIYGPAALTGKVYVHVSRDGSNYVILTSGGQDVEIPAGRGVPVDFILFKKLKLVGDTPQAAAREFGIMYGRRNG